MYFFILKKNIVEKKSEEIRELKDSIREAINITKGSTSLLRKSKVVDNNKLQNSKYIEEELVIDNFKKKFLYKILADYIEKVFLYIYKYINI